MKIYTKLVLPIDSAWDRKTWRTYTPIWLLEVIEGVKNVIRWIPIIYKDKDWDDYYITKILQTKIEHQREYLVKANRHTRIEEDNYWMTVLLNLLEREHEDYYSLEKYDYIKSNITFVESESHPECYEMKNELIGENLDAYLVKYPNTIRRVIKKYPDLDINDKEKLSLYVGIMNQEKCRNFIFKIMSQYSKRWWD
tara:strand:+ start:1905 stop:2492 length:588 start_codon:yes stop_codon:yes gene_type:complete